MMNSTLTVSLIKKTRTSEHDMEGLGEQTLILDHIHVPITELNSLATKYRLHIHRNPGADNRNALCVSSPLDDETQFVMLIHNLDGKGLDVHESMLVLMMMRALVLEVAHYSDPGHGWCQASKRVIELLAIADQISRYSYQDNDYAYLEEDRDAGIFLHAATKAGIEYMIREVHQEVTPIRHMAPYAP